MLRIAQGNLFKWWGFDKNNEVFGAWVEYVCRVITGWPIWGSDNWSFTEKAKIDDRGSLCIASESTGSRLQYDPDQISVPCSQSELSIMGKKIGRSVKGSFTEKA